MHTIIMFGLHILSYWGMVYVYDVKRDISWLFAATNSLRNQLLGFEKG